MWKKISPQPVPNYLGQKFFFYYEALALNFDCVAILIVDKQRPQTNCFGFKGNNLNFPFLNFSNRNFGKFGTVYSYEKFFLLDTVLVRFKSFHVNVHRGMNQILCRRYFQCPSLFITTAPTVPIYRNLSLISPTADRRRKFLIKYCYCLCEFVRIKY